MRLNEFSTTSKDGTYGKVLYAWARYERGDVPSPGKYDYINKRVLAKYPTAELVSMDRRFVPPVWNSGSERIEPTEVWWEFKWIVFDKPIYGN